MRNFTSNRPHFIPWREGGSTASAAGPFIPWRGDNQSVSAKVYVAPNHLTHEEQIVDLLENILETLKEENKK